MKQFFRFSILVLVQSNTDAVYGGTIARGESADNPSIQLRSANDDSGYYYDCIWW